MQHRITGLWLKRFADGHGSELKIGGDLCVDRNGGRALANFQECVAVIRLERGQCGTKIKPHENNTGRGHREGEPEEWRAEEKSLSSY